MKHCFTFILIWAGLTLSLHAQLPTVFNQNHFNAMVLNPAYAGSNEVLHAVALGRKQWLRFPGAPLNFSFTLDGPLRDEKNNFSAILTHDRIGATQRQLLMGGYAYRFDLGRGRLAFGLQGGLELWTSGLSDLYTVDPNDQNFTNSPQSFAIPRFGFGTRYETDRFFIGLSAPQLLWLNTGAIRLLRPELVRNRSYYARTGYTFPLSPEWELMPHALLKYAEGLDPQLDFGLLLALQGKYWLGPTYRSNGDLIFQAALQLSDQLRLGYAYDFQTSALRSLSSGSHSLSLTYDFLYKVNTTRPRYF